MPQFSIPKLGYVSNYVQNPPGTYIAVAVGVILIALVFLPDLFDKKQPEGEQPAEGETPNADAVSQENEDLKAQIDELRKQVEQKKDE